MRDVVAAYGSVYDDTNWTEDWKLTIALKHLRWDMVRPQNCLATTIPVSTVKACSFSENDGHEDTSRR